MKKKSIIISCIFFFICVLICFLRNKHFDYDDIAREKTGIPCISFTSYNRNPETKKLEETSIGISFDNPNLKDETSIDEIKKKGGAPFIFENAATECTMNAVRLNSSTDDVQYFRINISSHGVVYVFDNAEYRGEDYKLIACGEDWYLAFNRPGKIKE